MKQRHYKIFIETSCLDKILAETKFLLLLTHKAMAIELNRSEESSNLSP